MSETFRDGCRRSCRSTAMGLVVVVRRKSQCLHALPIIKSHVMGGLRGLKFDSRGHQGSQRSSISSTQACVNDRPYVAMPSDLAISMVQVELIIFGNNNPKIIWA